jgi:hypothetical protein
MLGKATNYLSGNSTGASLFPVARPQRGAKATSRQ